MMSVGSRRLGVGGMVIVVLLLLAPRVGHAAVACGAPDKDNTQTCTIDPAIDPAALCNDGTTPKFWIRPGKGSGAATWVIWLEGGGQCFNQASCALRAQTPSSAGLLTSNGYVATDGYGLLSSRIVLNPDLYNATTVQVHYCSSDDWVGGYSASKSFSPIDPTTWNFQGRRIALAAIRSLGELPYNLAGAGRIVLGGTSAGGVGMTDDVNDILPILPVAATKLLVNDAGFTLDIGQYDASLPSPYVYPSAPNAFDTTTSQSLTLWQGRGDAPCAASAITTQQQVNCYNSAYVLQNAFITVPSFVAESQIDTAQVSLEICPLEFGLCSVPASPTTKQGIYATEFGVSMAAALTGAGTQAAYSVASPDAYMHAILVDPEEFLEPFSIPGGVTTPELVFHNWFVAPAGKRNVQLGNGPGVN